MTKENPLKISVLSSLYRCEEYLDDYFINLLSIVNLHEVEFLFIHNDPTPKEKSIIDEYLHKNPQIIYQYVEVPRERLYKSWNRGVKMAKGTCIAVWNVDDKREPYSLLNQASFLTENPNAGLVYGNKYIYRSKNDIKPELHNTEQINKKSWYKKFQDGSLIMWRKSVHDEIGFFDEQFVSLGDQDFWYRVIAKYDIVKCPTILGSFLAERGKGISKRSNKPGIEKIVIGLRYGFFTYINFWGWRKAFKEYDVTHILYEGLKTKVTVLKYNHFAIYFYSLRTIILSMLK